MLLLSPSLWCFAMLNLIVCVTTIRSKKPWFGAPEQVHLSWLGNPTEMWVTWVTLDIYPQNDTEEYTLPHWRPVPFPVDANGSVVEFGETGFTRNSSGIPIQIYKNPEGGRIIYIHRAHMTGLKPKTEYFYHVGSQGGWSDMFWFKTLPSGTGWSPRIAVFGDFGNSDAVSLAPLQEETQKGNFDLLWHIGDFAYDLDADGGKVGDQFMRQMQPLTAYVPYQVVVGNHEIVHNYSQYKARFTMPNYKDIGNLFYSYNAGPAHIIVYSSEFYYVSFETVKNQYRWLENDLKEAAQSANRKNRPWIITMGHRPMYCSTYDGDDCRNEKDSVRKGVNTNLDTSPPVYFGLEDLFCKYGVDLNIVAHEHIYERLWPVYNNEVYNGSTSSNPYDNPGALVHIISGSAGCMEDSDKMIPTSERKKWSAFAQGGVGPLPPKRGRGTKGSYGYGHLNILNKTTIYWEQVSTYPFSEIGKVIDKFTLIKRENNHKYSICK